MVLGKNFDLKKTYRFFGVNIYIYIYIYKIAEVRKKLKSHSFLQFAGSVTRFTQSAALFILLLANQSRAFQGT